MKHLMMTVVTVLTLGATMTMVKADTYQSGRDADIMRERGQVWNYSESKRDPQLANYNTDGRYLSEATNFELYNFVGLFKLRKSAKKEIKVIKEQKATEHMNEELIRMIKLRIQGLPDEVEKFSEQLKKGGYHFLMESDDYPNRNSEYVRRYVEIRLKEQE